MAQATSDYYAVLGVPRTASADELQKAYRKLARRNHPDVNKEPAAEERFKQINEAYHVLGDPDTRARYDRYGKDFRSAGESGHAGAGARHSWGSSRGGGRGDSGARGRGFSGAGGPIDLDDLLGGLFGGAPGGGPGGRWTTGADQEAELALSLEEAYTGGRRTIEVADREFDVTIPPGALDGQRIRLPGQGGRGGGPRDGGDGDLYLVVRIRPHPRFRLTGRDISVEVPIAPWEGALGGTVAMATPTGEVTVTVPAGSPTGRRLRLRGQGMPNPRGTPGDLYAEVRVMLPRTVTDDERALYEQLRHVSTFDPRESRR